MQILKSLLFILLKPLVVVSRHVTISGIWMSKVSAQVDVL